MTLRQLVATPVGRQNAHVLAAAEQAARSRWQAQRRQSIDGADVLQATARQLTHSDDPALAHAAQVVASLERDRPFQTFKIDLAFVDEDRGIWLAFEINGGYSAPRGGKHATERDREKVWELQQAGYKVREFTSTRCTRDPIGVMQAIARIVEEARQCVSRSCLTNWNGDDHE